jgi:myo-inositol-1(or 4)-monophosphatase
MQSTTRVFGMPNDEILDKVLLVAIDASKKAGDIIIGNAGGAEVTERKANSRDLLTLIDPMCEKVREDSLCNHFCNHRWIPSIILNYIKQSTEYLAWIIT